MIERCTRSIRATRQRNDGAIIGDHRRRLRGVIFPAVESTSATLAPHFRG
jgi:hypothetical protein